MRMEGSTTRELYQVTSFCEQFLYHDSLTHSTANLTRIKQVFLDSDFNYVPQLKESAYSQIHGPSAMEMQKASIASHLESQNERVTAGDQQISGLNQALEGGKRNQEGWQGRGRDVGNQGVEDMPLGLNDEDTAGEDLNRHEERRESLLKLRNKKLSGLKSSSVHKMQRDPNSIFSLLPKPKASLDQVAPVSLNYSETENSRNMSVPDYQNHSQNTYPDQRGYQNPKKNKNLFEYTQKLENNKKRLLRNLGNVKEKRETEPQEEEDRFVKAQSFYEPEIK